MNNGVSNNNHSGNKQHDTPNEDHKDIKKPKTDWRIRLVLWLLIGIISLYTLIKLFDFYEKLYRTK